MNLLQMLPARYAKAITAVVGAAITYIETVGVHWDLKAALLYFGLVLGVGAVPNATPAPPTVLSGRPLVAAAPAEPPANANFALPVPPPFNTTPVPPPVQGAQF
jgi:hypothetical protein